MNEVTEWRNTTKLIKDATLYTADAWRQGRSIPTVNVVPLVRDLRDALMAAEARVSERTDALYTMQKQRDLARAREDELEARVKELTEALREIEGSARSIVDRCGSRSRCADDELRGGGDHR